MNTVYPWHQSVVERLVVLRDSDQLPNAVALTCMPGWGHEELLSQVAMLLLEDDVARHMEEFAHPDFRWITPDRAVIKIDQVRRLTEFAVQTTQIAPRKVAAILDAHLLNEQAANALLKILEEPPPNTHLLLATSHWGKLIPTIRSRCQRFQSSPRVDLAQVWLREQKVVVTDAQFAEFGYAPLTTHSQLGNSTMDLTAWLAGLPEAALDDAVKAVLDTEIVVWLGRWYRRLLLHLGGHPIPQCDVSAKAILEFSDELLSIRRQIESTNSANPRLLLEYLIVHWLQLQRRRGASRG